MSRYRGVALALTALALTAGCDTSNYAFKVDKTIKVVAPKARQQVGLPVVVRWTDTRAPQGLRVAPTDPKANYYAIFLDRVALGPGKRLTSLIKGQVECASIKGCPTVAQLAEVRVFLSAKPQVSLEFVADLRTTTRGNTKDVHEVTIVRMRGDHRIGETAFLQTFFVRR